MDKYKIDVHGCTCAHAEMPTDTYMLTAAFLHDPLVLGSRTRRGKAKWDEGYPGSKMHRITKGGVPVHDMITKLVLHMTGIARGGTSQPGGCVSRT